MNNRDPSSDTAMPRGFCASLSVAVTRSVTVSMIEIDAEPSLGTYANGAAAAAAVHAAASAIAKRINPGTPSSLHRVGSRANDRLCYTSLPARPPEQFHMESSNRCDEGRDRMRALVLFAAGWSAVAAAQIPQRIDPLVVTATRTEERAFDLPVAIDSIDAAQIQRNQLQVNLSESLSRVPGIVVANRWNYAQDLQVSARGFGARANFGVRGIRLYQDGIPATMPDGQGQTGSFSLVSTQRIEVLRGPFSTLYGNAAGGVISVFTEDGADPSQAQGQVVGGSYATYNAIAKTSGVARDAGYVLAANHFATDGYRDHSEASRDLVNAKLKFAIDADTRMTLIGNSLYQPEAQDPLGLTRAQWEANPRQADPSAELFDTRKTVNQTQGGAAIERRLGTDTILRVIGYGGGGAERPGPLLPAPAVAPFRWRV